MTSQCVHLVEIQSTRDNLASCGDHVDELQQVSTILGRLASTPEYDNAVVVIHESFNNYDIQAVCSVLQDTETRLRDTVLSLIRFLLILLFNNLALTMLYHLLPCL